jgi:flagellar basal-body rod protein FlgB
VNLLDTPYFSALRARLDFLSGRQKLIAENIANASTPGFKPRDMDAKAFDRALQTQLRSGETGRDMPQARIVTRPDSETTLDGNAVVIEEQMLRATETRANFETGLALYQKGLQLLRMAAKPPGR